LSTWFVCMMINHLCIKGSKDNNSTAWRSCRSFWNTS
jgi:hypothetical protein